MNMGERIKQLRIENGLTQEELGKYIGVQKSAIRKYEKGEVKNMKRSSIQILSNLFKVSPSYLMCIDEEDEIKTNNNTITTSIPLLSDFKNDLETSITNFLIKYISVNESFPDNTFALKINDIDAEIFKIKDAMLAFELLNQLNKIAKTMLAPPNKYAPIITIPPIHQKSLQYL